MFGSALVKMNTSYLNSNPYGSGFNLNMSCGYSMPSSYSCNSVFNAGVSFTPAGYSSMYPVSYAAVMPMPAFGGFCGGFGNFGWFGAMPFLQNFMDMMTTFSTLNTTNSITDNYINKGKSSSNTAVSASGYSPSYTPFSNMFSWMPTLNTNFSLSTTSSKKNNTKYTFHTSSFNTKSNLPALKDAGYDEEKGYNLAKTAAGNAVGFTHKCAKYVRIALEKNGLSNGMRGDGYEYANILSQNNNFKEISTKDVNLSSLPAGCVLVYGQGVAGYDSKAGHVEITLGNGQAVSDGVTNNIRPGARVFVPVSA